MSFGQLFIQTSGHIIDSRVIQTRIVLIVVSCPIHNLGTARLKPAKFSSKFFLKYDPSSMQHWDSNSEPLGRQSPLITPRSGLPPFQFKVLQAHSCFQLELQRAKVNQPKKQRVCEFLLLLSLHPLSMSLSLTHTYSLSLSLTLSHTLSEPSIFHPPQISVY